MDNITKPDKIVFSNRKSLSLVIKPSGEFVVRSPKSFSKERILEFITKKQDWIIKHRTKIIESKVDTKVFVFEDGSYFNLKGETAQVIYNDSQVKSIIFDDIKKKLFINPKLKNPSKAGYDWLMKKAKVDFEEGVKYWSKVTKLYPKNIRITNAKTRWGSCTSKNTISLNWRLILVPPTILNYVIIHELAHIKQKNHSVFFWNLVENYDANFKDHRKWLKTNGNNLITIFDPRKH